VLTFCINSTQAYFIWRAKFKKKKRLFKRNEDPPLSPTQVATTGYHEPLHAQKKTEKKNLSNSVAHAGGVACVCLEVAARQ